MFFRQISNLNNSKITCRFDSFQRSYLWNLPNSFLAFVPILFIVETFEVIPIDSRREFFINELQRYIYYGYHDKKKEYQIHCDFVFIHKFSLIKNISDGVDLRKGELNI
jgi:hypothetical protein